MSRVIKPEQQIEIIPLDITFRDMPLVFDDDNDGTSDADSEGDAVNPVDEELLQKADAILKEATREGEEIVRQARLEADEIRQAAFSKGYSDGREQGMAEGRELGAQEFASAIELVKRIHNEMQRLQSSLEKENHKAAVRLAIEIAKKIVKKEVLTDEDTVIRVIADALGTLVDMKAPETVLVRVNPQELALVEGSASTIKSMLAGVEGFSVEADPSVERGGCVIETNLGSLDARMETQLDAVERAILERMEDVLANGYEPQR